MPPQDQPGYFSHWSDLLIRYNNWLLGNNITALEACMSYIGQLEGIDRVIVGAHSVQQLKQIAANKTAKGISPPEDMQSTDENLVNPARWQL